MMKRRCLALLLLCLLGLAIVIAVIFGIGPFYRNPSEAMSQREVTRCFRRNFDFLVVVADYLEPISYDSGFGFHVRIEDGVPVLRTHHGDNRIDIEDERVVNAIMHLWEQGYSDISSSHSHNFGGNVTFVRDMRQMARRERLPDEGFWDTFFGHYGGVFRTGVEYLFDDRDPWWDVPLSRPNWYFFARLGDG